MSASFDKNVGNVADKLSDVGDTVESGISRALQTSDQLAYGGSSPVNLGFARLDLMDGDQSCAS